jgi:ribosomal protein L11 methyltransferase
MSEPHVRTLAEQDWAEAWKKHYSILHLGKHIVIKPSWLDYIPQPEDMVIELDPGMAFGTGLHPSTRLCLVALEKIVTPGIRVLDVGAGSGILSIACAKLGAREVLALDIDPVAVETALKNVAFNHVESNVQVKKDSIDPERDRNLYDLVCINILAEVIADLTPALASALHSGGQVIASGILDYKAEDVVQAFATAGIVVLEQSHEDDWVAIIGKRT